MVRLMRLTLHSFFALMNSQYNSQKTKIIKVIVKDPIPCLLLSSAKRVRLSTVLTLVNK